MSDLIEQLREEGLGFGIGPAMLCQEAAAEITHLRAALAEKMVVKVKPLEWIKHPTAEIWRCDTMIGTYKVFGLGPTPSWDFDGLDDKGIPLTKTSVSTSADVAKAAAQADYERRILSAVEAVPASQIRADALREAGAVACGYPGGETICNAIIALIDAPKVTT